MKVATILGTRPEIIRLSKLIPLLDELCEHQVFHTGQNRDPELDANFFAELGLRKPDRHVHYGDETFAGQLSHFLPPLEDWLKNFRPDRFLVLGDTNSSVGALIAARLGIPVYHLEAGNRCCGPESPEEMNRKVIDHTATVHLCYSERSRANLLAEGLPISRTFVVGNPLAEILLERDADLYVSASDVAGREVEKYAVASLHRAENVDDERLWDFLAAMNAVAEDMDWQVFMSTHPRTRKRLLIAFGEQRYPNIIFLKPQPFSIWICLERHADIMFSDSGTAPETCAILRTPLVVLRDYMERQALLEKHRIILWTDRSETTLRAAVDAVLRPSFTLAQTDEAELRPTAQATARHLLSPVPPA